MKRQFACLIAISALSAPALSLDLFGGKAVGQMGEIQVTATQMRELIEAQTPEVRKTLLDNPATLRDLIQAELLRRTLIAEAKKAEWDKRPNVALTMERAREQAMIDDYIAARIEPAPTYPPEKDIAATYEANKAQFRIPSQLHLAQILLRVSRDAGKEVEDKAAATAKEVSAKLALGGKFADFVQLYSQDEGSKDKGGDLGWLSLDALNPQIRAEIGNLKPGEVSKPLRTPFGWQIIKVVERKAEAIRPLLEVRDTIVKALREAQAQENRKRYLDDLRKQTPVSVEDGAFGDIWKN